MKTYAEHIASLEATRADKQKRMKELHQSSVDAGRTMDAAEAEEFEGLEREIGTIDADIARTKKLEAIDKGTAAPPDGKEKADATAGTTPLRADLNLRQVEKLEPGIAFSRYAMCLLKAKGDHQIAFRLAERHYPRTESVVKTLKAQAEGADLGELIQLKTAIAAGTTTDSTWAQPLATANVFMGDFISYLRPKTLIGQAQFRPIPFNVKINGQTSGGTANWVGQGKPKPVTKFDFNQTTVPFSKVAAIAVLTQELARFSDPSAEALVRDSLADCVIAKIDGDLFDPDAAAVANVSPAGLLNGVSPIVTTLPKAGVDADDIRCALQALWAPWDSTFLGARPAYYTTPGVARYLSFLRDALGNPAFPGVTPFGGTLNGIPVRVSQYLANNGGSGGAPFILVDEAEIYLADDGSVTLDASDVASLEMSDSPTNNSSTPTAASMVSMWQTNSVALRAERFIWWGARRSGAAQWIDGFPSGC